MSIVPQLYQPSALEINKVAKSAKQRHPDCAARIDKAAAILASGSLTLEPVGWEVRNSVRWHVCSQSHAKAGYIVCGLHCPCQDSRATVVAGVRSCKHSISISLYLKVLANHVNCDIHRREIDLGILPNGEFHAYAKGMGHVQMRKIAPSGLPVYLFTDAASAVRYSLWLAQPVVVEWPVAELVAIAADTFDPADIIDN